ncbi:MAG: serine/threonine-protein phosphatase [Clostridia bacterium]|jgi:protein phosphatase|nr:serine/threonine-protein phosphatase [Clostridia bacterium]
MDEIKKKILDNALYDTYFTYLERNGQQAGEDQMIGALREYIHTGELDFFTKINDSRKIMRNNFKRDDLARYMAEYLYEMSKTKVSEDELESEIFFEIKKQEMFFSSKEDIIQSISNCLLGKETKAFGFNYNEIANVAGKLYLDNEVSKVKQERDRQQRDLERNLEKGLDPRFGVKNVQVNWDAYNHCRREVLDGSQIIVQNDLKAKDPSRRPRRTYSLNDELMAVTDIGNRRQDQEDSVLILYHPKNPKYKMLVVADGMGGSKNGQLASMEIVKQMIGWFESLPVDYMKEDNRKYLCEAWNEKLLDISDDIVRKYPGSSSTFVGAIVGEESTTIASAGDSRAYVLGNDNNLYQMTVDDNLAYRAWNKQWTQLEKQEKNRGVLMQIAKGNAKDDLRFRKDANVVTNGLGLREKPRINFSRARNDTYKTLMLFSDGVTDCLSDKQIMAITKSTKPAYLATALVNEAITKDSNKPELAQSENHFIHIPAGKDNTTAAVYDNTRRGDER